jgi:hypothetical protein
MMNKRSFEKDAKEKVKYIKSRKARIKYQVMMGECIRYRVNMKLPGEPVDTETIYNKYEKKYTSEGHEAERKMKGKKVGDLGLAGGPFAAWNWNHKALIWVCVLDRVKKDFRFYTHVCKPDQFHHSSFVAGNGVVGAGAWIIEKGVLTYLSATSGHYRPDMSTFHGAVVRMAASFHRDRTKVVLWDSRNWKWEARPVDDFIAHPSDGGRYWVNPPPGEWETVAKDDPHSDETTGSEDTGEESAAASGESGEG